MRAVAPWPAALWIALWAAALLAASAVFLLAPWVDLAVSGWFYDAQHGFGGTGSAWVVGLAGSVPWIARGIFLLAIIGAAYLLLTGRPLWRLDRKALLFIVLSTALGPGLVVNTVLKDHWGRARPVQIANFGGAHHFTPAPLLADQCDRNCAFVSGHAALGFSLIGFALLLPAGWQRRTAITAALGFGAAVGLARIAAGGHFLSDVVFAGLITMATSLLLYDVIVKRDLFAHPTARRLYRRVGGGLALPLWSGTRFDPPAPGRLAVVAGGLAIIEAVSMIWLDRPIAWFFHGRPALHPTFEAIQRFGVGTPYLVLFALLYIALRWGGAAPGLQHRAEPMRMASKAPAFLFAAVGLSGLLIDLLKLVFGRTRPKLLFAAGEYAFTWLGTQADHWSFPSGHAATAAALMAGLWCLWPRFLPLYIVAAVLVALSRVVTGAHYPSDVVMGAFIGVVATRYIAVAFARERTGTWAGLLATRRSPLPHS